MGSKRQQTFAKMERERTVRERRAQKAEKKAAAAAERNALKTGAGLEKDERGEAGAQPYSQSSVSPAASPAPVPSASPQHRRN